MSSLNETKEVAFLQYLGQKILISPQILGGKPEFSTCSGQGNLAAQTDWRCCLISLAGLRQ